MHRDIDTSEQKKFQKHIITSETKVSWKSSAKKNILLSIMRPLNGDTKDDNKKKSNIYKFYYFTTGKMDIVGKLSDYYPRVTDGT